MTLLEVKGVTKRFGGLTAVDDVSFEIAEGKILGLVGPNGAGKTTLFNCISGLYRVNSGMIVLGGRDITNKPAHIVCRAGIGRTFQIVQNFERMTLTENIMVGAFLRSRGKKQAAEKALEILEFIQLQEKKDVKARNLSPPEKRRLGLGMALATEPRLLMLDEVMAGLTPVEIDGVLDLLCKIQETGVSIIVIEHVMRAVMAISEKIIVLDSGKKISEGPPEEIAHDDKVIRAYLGKSYAGG